jgi:hypothetical protein
MLSKICVIETSIIFIAKKYNIIIDRYEKHKKSGTKAKTK